MSGGNSLKRLGREADHSPPFSAKAKDALDLYAHSPLGFYGVVLN
jgi:hypothetical protein